MFGLIVNAQCEWSVTKTNSCVDFNVTGEGIYLYPFMDNTVRITQCGQHGQKQNKNSKTVWTTRSEQHSVHNTVRTTQCGQHGQKQNKTKTVKQCGQHGQSTVWTTRSEQHSVDNTVGITQCGQHG